MKDDETLAVAGHFPHLPAQQNEPKPRPLDQIFGRCTYKKPGRYPLVCNVLCAKGATRCLVHTFENGA